MVRARTRVAVVHRSTRGLRARDATPALADRVTFGAAIAVAQAATVRAAVVLAVMGAAATGRVSETVLASNPRSAPTVHAPTRVAIVRRSTARGATPFRALMPGEMPTARVATPRVLRALAPTGRGAPRGRVATGRGPVIRASGWSTGRVRSPS